MSWVETLKPDDRIRRKRILPEVGNHAQIVDVVSSTESVGRLTPGDAISVRWVDGGTGPLMLFRRTIERHFEPDEPDLPEAA